MLLAAHFVAQRTHMINMHFVMQASFWSSCSKAPWNDDASNSEKQYVEFIDKSKRNQSICLKIYSTCTLNTTVPILYIYILYTQSVDNHSTVLGDTGGHRDTKTRAGGVRLGDTNSLRPLGSNQLGSQRMFA